MKITRRNFVRAGALVGGGLVANQLSPEKYLVNQFPVISLLLFQHGEAQSNPQKKHMNI